MQTNLEVLNSVDHIITTSASDSECASEAKVCERESRMSMRISARETGRDSERDTCRHAVLVAPNCANAYWNLIFWTCSADTE